MAGRHPQSPEILAPAPSASLRARIGRDLFADENLDHLAHLLDDCFHVPGTSIRFGIDGIIGLVPGLGDVLAGLASLLIIVAAWFRGAPAITLTRMVANVGIGVIVGAVPLFGDMFDIFWKANRRNYALLSRHLAQPYRHTWRDWAFLMLLGVAVVSIFAAPLVVLVWLVAWLVHPR
jgi:hypothetical protein